MLWAPGLRRRSPDATSSIRHETRRMRNLYKLAIFAAARPGSSATLCFLHANLVLSLATKNKYTWKNKFTKYTKYINYTKHTKYKLWNLDIQFYFLENCSFFLRFIFSMVLRHFSKILFFCGYFLDVWDLFPPIPQRQCQSSLPVDNNMEKHCFNVF